MKKVLVIDDDVDFLATMERLLKSYNLQLVPATSSDNVEVIIRRLKPVMVILDVFLGNEDGRTIYQSIKEVHTQLDIPVILCSGMQLTKEELQQMPGTTFVAKPLSVAKIEELLSNLKEPASM